MKIKLAVSVLASFFLLVGVAQAFHWHMTYGQAKHSSKEFAEAACRQDHKCTGYGVGACRRASDSRFDCEIGLFYAEEPEPEQEVECDILLHWGVNRSGIVTLKNYGRPHCARIK